MQLHSAQDRFHAAGAGLYLIGNGRPAAIPAFREVTGYTGALYTDPSLAVYRAAQLRRGLGTVLTLGALTRTVGAIRRGYRQGRTEGSALQQGGTLVIDPLGRVRLHHVSSGPGDHTPIDDIVAAVVAASGTAVVAAAGAAPGAVVAAAGGRRDP